MNNKIWLLIEYGNVSTCFYLWEGPHNAGIVDKYKRNVRDNGGRVVAVIRPKRHVAS